LIRWESKPDAAPERLPGAELDLDFVFEKVKEGGRNG
jgi:hypothetical protein